MPDHRDTVVVTDRSSNNGLIFGVVALVVILVVGWYFLMGPGAGTLPFSTEVNVNVEAPAPDAGGGSGGDGGDGGDGS
jgi:hypothetical protein